MASNKSNGTACILPMCVFLVFLLFLGLKLAEVGQVATWSWIWVTSPLWIYFGFVILCVLAVLFIALIAHMLTKD